MSDELKARRAARRSRAGQEQRKAQSLYGQVRLTVTFEPSGRAHFRALAKRPTDDWRELNVFAMGYDDFASYPPTFEDALEMFSLIAERLRWMPHER
jgi:hypothetical protein